MKISIIIPVRNEEKIIEMTVKKLKEQLKIENEIIIVNDYSTDNSVEVIKRIINNYDNIYFFNNKDSPGIANAIKTGFKYSKGKFVIPFMADFSDAPKTIEEMYEKVKKGFDIACGSRYIKGGEQIGGPFLKSLFSRFAGLSLYFLTRIPTHDITNAFKMYRKEVIEKINIESKGFEISFEIPLKAFLKNYKITEVPTVWRDRSVGKSKFHVFKSVPIYLRWYFWFIIKRFVK